MTCLLTVGSLGTLQKDLPVQVINNALMKAKNNKAMALEKSNTERSVHTM